MQHETRQSSLLDSLKNKEEAKKTPRLWVSYFVTIVGHYFGVMIEGLQCCWTPLLEVA